MQTVTRVYLIYRYDITSAQGVRTKGMNPKSLENGVLTRPWKAKDNRNCTSLYPS